MNDNTEQRMTRNLTALTMLHFAREIGEQREREYLELIDYGNTDSSGAIDRFWLEGGLKISAATGIWISTQ